MVNACKDLQHETEQYQKYREMIGFAHNSEATDARKMLNRLLAPILNLPSCRSCRYGSSTTCCATVLVDPNADAHAVPVARESLTFDFCVRNGEPREFGLVLECR